MKIFILFFLFFGIIITNHVYGSSAPQPFGLKLGLSTKEEVIKVLEKEGGQVVKSGFRIIKGEIVNPNVEGIKVEGLPIEQLKEATFWFFRGKLFRIVYSFPLSMSHEEFYVLYKQLEAKYGKPKRYVKPYLADGLAEWFFKDVKVKLRAPWVSWNMYLIYEHLSLSKEAELSDQDVFQREVSKPKKGL